MINIYEVTNKKNGRYGVRCNANGKEYQGVTGIFARAENLVNEMNAGELDPIHFDDVIKDFQFAEREEKQTVAVKVFSALAELCDRCGYEFSELYQGAFGNGATWQIDTGAERVNIHISVKRIMP